MRSLSQFKVLIRWGDDWKLAGIWRARDPSAALRLARSAGWRGELRAEPAAVAAWPQQSS